MVNGLHIRGKLFSHEGSAFKDQICCISSTKVSFLERQSSLVGQTNRKSHKFFAFLKWQENKRMPSVHIDFRSQHNVRPVSRSSGLIYCKVV